MTNVKQGVLLALFQARPSVLIATVNKNASNQQLEPENEARGYTYYNMAKISGKVKGTRCGIAGALFFFCVSLAA